MLKIPLPANLNYLLNAIVSISNLCLLPKEMIKSFIKSVFKTSSQELTNKFADSDIF
jgi:hypothetical protein